MAPWLVAGVKSLIVKIIIKRSIKRMFKGKLTYTMLAGWAVSIAARVLGDGVVTEADMVALAEFVGVVLGVYGRYRAARV